jgi:4a-hydroxytetrahydrobiopterin dehydratase
MNELAQKSCQPCTGSSTPLDANLAATLLAQVPGWELAAGGSVIRRRFSFKGFHQAMAFVNAVAWIAHQQGHHPDLDAGYDYCLLRFTTHAIGGLSENDFICAARVNELLGN